MDEFKDILEEKDFKYYFEKYKIIILIIVLIVIILALLIFKLNKKEVKNNNKILTQTKEIKTEKKEEKVKTVKVDIKGEVLNPYVYELAINSRIIDVINKAGGLKEEADTTYINLSKKIKDEMVIIIYSKKDIAGFPKGHIEYGEDEKKAAKREVFEEVGIEVELDPTFKEKLHYNIKGTPINKEVVLFMSEISWFGRLNID